MIEIMIILVTVITMIGVHIWPKITWSGEDWRHLELCDWDESASRGRIKQWRVE
jgi:hypothetical protein